MRLMQSGAHFVICDELMALRIQGKIFYSDIGDLINTYSDVTIYRCEEQLIPSGFGFTSICEEQLIPSSFGFTSICEFTTNEDLKEQMIEYLI